MHLSRCVKRTLRTQTGFILLPVVLAIVLIATIAFLLTHESAINVDMTVSTEVAAEADQVARAGLAHATWGAQNSGCAGDMAMTTVPFGQAGTDSYTATVTTPGGAATAYPNLAADQDAWFRSDDITNNNGGQPTLHLRREFGNLEYAVVRFDLSTLPVGAQINSAMARFYVDAGKGHPEGPVSVHRATADWLENDATWETMGDKFESVVLDTIPAQPAAGDNWVTVNLTAQVQAWVNGGMPNYGIMLIPTGEGTHAEYMSRDGGANTQPRLDVIVGTGPATPATISATGTLTGNPGPANDITRTLTHTDVPAYQPPGSVTLQLGADAGEDTLLDSFYDLRNFGGANYLQVHDNGSDWQQYPLIRFDLARLPRGASVRSARLELKLLNLNAPGAATIHQVTRSWVEGTKSGGGIADGATWFTRDGTNPWTSAGGDINAPVVAETAIIGGETWVSWEIAPLVERWLAGEPNYGLLIKPDSALKEAEFASKENSTAGVQPKLTLTYACECGSPCLAPQGSGTVAMVVVDPTNLVPLDEYKKALLESWGYSVDVLGESENQATYDSAAAAADVVFISETVNSLQVGAKLKNVTIGVVSQDGIYSTVLGFSSGRAWPVGAAINVTDTSHYITALFPAGPLDIYSAGMEQLTVSGAEASGLQTLADTGGAGSLVVLDTGAMGLDGNPVAGRRVMLPLGRDNNFNWDYLNSNGWLIVQRAIQWGAGSSSGVPVGNLLLIVGDASSPASKDLGYKALMESWGYVVTLLDDGDSQANYDTAMAAADVIYASGSALGANMLDKATFTTKGLVNEVVGKIDNFGFSSSTTSTVNTDTFTATDAAHYITETFGGGPVTVFTSSLTNPVPGGTLAPGMTNVGEVSGTLVLGTLDIGAMRFDSIPSQGRRAHLPFASAGATDLTADGATIIKRSLEWAAGAGTSTPQNLLLVVVDPASLLVQEAAKKTLIESWGYAVSLIDEADSQANFDAALAANDVVYITEDVVASTVGTKLVNAAVGVVTEEDNLSDEFGFSDGIGWDTGVEIQVNDNTHYITQPFALGNLTLFTASESLAYLTGSVAPDLQVLGRIPSGSSLVSVAAGADLIAGRTAAGRRVLLPWGGNDFDLNNLNSDGRTLMRRALDWAAGTGSGGGGGGGPPPTGGVVFEEFTDAKLGGNGSSLVINKPAGTAVGDLLIAAVATDGNHATTLAPPAGWTAVEVSQQGGAVTFGVWWKLAGASEAADYTFSWSGGEKAYGMVMRFTGHDPVNPIHVSANTGGTSASPTAPGVTTTVPDTMILRLGGFDDGDISVGNPGLSGHTSITMDESSTGGNSASAGAGYLTQTAVGGSGTSSFLLSASEQYRTVTLAIAPAP